MADYGITPTGFVKKTLQEIKSSLQDALATIFGTPRTDEGSTFGGLIGPFAKETADVWELVELLYNSQTKFATDLSMDNILQLVGLTRRAASNSSVVACCFGTQGTSIPLGSTAKVENTENIFSTAAAVTIDQANILRCTIELTADGDPAYTVKINGEDFTSNSAGDEIAIATDLVSIINDALTGSTAMVAKDNLDGTFRLTDNENEIGYPIILVAGSLSLTEFGSPVTFRADLTGPIAAPGPVDGLLVYTEGALNIIQTPVSGWDRVENLQDATLGTDLETDGEARARREASLQSRGSATVETIQARILNDIAGVVDCTVFENDTDSVDGAGRLPHSFEAIVEGGDDQEIAEKIWEVKAAGIQTVGNANGGAGYTVPDSQGIDHTIKYSRPVPKLVYAHITITRYLEEAFPVNGTALVAQSFVDYGESNTPLGKDLIEQRFYDSIFVIPGIATAVIEWAITDESDPAPAYPGDYATGNIAIGPTSIARFNIARVNVPTP